MSDNSHDQFADFQEYMRFAISSDLNSPLDGQVPDTSPTPNLLPEYPAPAFKASEPSALQPASNLPLEQRAREQLLRELQNDLAKAHAQAVVVKWTGFPDSRLENVEIPSSVWRDLGDLSDVDLLETGFMELEFPKGFANQKLVMRGKVLFFGVRFIRELSAREEVNQNAHNRTRVSRYDWHSFEAEAKRLILDEGGFQPGWNQAACETAMANWCEGNWEKTPSENSIRTHVKNANNNFLAEFRGQLA